MPVNGLLGGCVLRDWALSACTQFGHFNAGRISGYCTCIDRYLLTTEYCLLEDEVTSMFLCAKNSCLATQSPIVFLSMSSTMYR